MSKRGNGEGSIYYNKTKKKWIAQYTAGLNDKGKPKRLSVSANTRKEVSIRLIEAQNGVNKGTFVDKSKITLYEILNSIIEEDLTSNRVKEVTYKRTKDNLKIIDKLTCSHLPIQKVTSNLINDDLLENLIDYSDSVINKVYGLLRKAFNKAVLLNILSSSPFNIEGLIIKPKSKNKTKTIEALTVEEQKAFLDELNDSNNKYKSIFIIAVFTGMRVGEILALKKDDIDLEKKIININRTVTKDKNDNVILGDSTKTYSGMRSIPIPINIFDTVKISCSATKDLLFTNTGKLISPSTINLQFKKICKDTKLRLIVKDDGKFESNVNMHMLRHTYATRCIESGMQAIVLSKLLGHKDVDVTLNTYTTVFNKYKQEEIEQNITYLKNLGIISLDTSLESNTSLDETINLLKNIYSINKLKFNEVSKFINDINSGLQPVCNPTIKIMK